MQTWKYRIGYGSNLKSPSNSPCPRDCDRAHTFSYNRPTNSVAVENLPSQIHKLEVVSLFHSLIAEVQSFRDVMEGGNLRLELTFFDQDAATKALCMNGYTVGGVPLRVSPLITHLAGNRSKKDDRRNLYVLGLPFALTKSEFTSCFAQYGTVSHCVILATVDNSSRRRGFIVMSTHEEAKSAMAALTRTQIKGHTIDVSWAVVQRSQGFLDGGDRSMILDARTHIPTPSRLQERSGFLQDLPHSSEDANSTFLITCSVPAMCLLVSNLPTMLFSQAQDLHPLFFPFGQIDRLGIVHISPLGYLSVIVQYTSTSSAQEAKESLNGQLYGNFRIEARYVRLSPWALQHCGQNMAPRLRPLERRMTDPLPRSSDYALHHPGPPTPLGFSPAKSFGNIFSSGALWDFFLDRESNHSTPSEDSSRVSDMIHTSKDSYRLPEMK